MRKRNETVTQSGRTVSTPSLERQPWQMEQQILVEQQMPWPIAGSWFVRGMDRTDEFACQGIRGVQRAVCCISLRAPTLMICMRNGRSSSARSPTNTYRLSGIRKTRGLLLWRNFDINCLTSHTNLTRPPCMHCLLAGRVFWCSCLFLFFPSFMEAWS